MGGTLEAGDAFIPQGGSPEEAWRSITHLGIGAHPDDLEFMAFHGIEACRRGGGKFGGIVVTDGAGSVRGRGEDAAELRARRSEEQRNAAEIGGYAVMLQLGLTSSEARQRENPVLTESLAKIFRLAKPGIVYTHNPADRHDTHVAVSVAVIEALRSLPRKRRPAKVYGCEVWRDLDWLTGDDRVRLDCGSDEAFAAALNEVFQSQIGGGKRYDLAVLGRRRAQATFDDPRSPDAAEMVTLAMDLTPLVKDAGIPIADHVLAAVDRFRADVARRLS